MKSLWNHLTYANLMSTLAMIMLASGGTAYAATHLPQGSVTTAQVKNGSLLAKDFKAGQLRPERPERPERPAFKVCKGLRAQPASATIRS